MAEVASNTVRAANWGQFVSKMLKATGTFLHCVVPSIIDRIFLCDDSGIKGLEKLWFWPKYLLVLGSGGTCRPLLCLVIGRVLGRARERRCGCEDAHAEAGGAKPKLGWALG